MLDYKEIYKQLSAQQNDKEGISIADDTARSAKALEDIQLAISQEKEDRIKSEKAAKTWQIASMIIGILTLIATIVFGLLTA